MISDSFTSIKVKSYPLWMPHLHSPEGVLSSSLEFPAVRTDNSTFWLKRLGKGNDAPLLNLRSGQTGGYDGAEELSFSAGPGRFTFYCVAKLSHDFEPLASELLSPSPLLLGSVHPTSSENVYRPFCRVVGGLELQRRNAVGSVQFPVIFWAPGPYWIRKKTLPFNTSFTIPSQPGNVCWGVRVTCLLYTSPSPRD